MSDTDTNTEFTIRRARAEDVDEITRLWCALQDDIAELEPRLRIAPTAGERFHEYYLDVIGKSSTACFLAAVGSAAAGFVLGQIHERPTLAYGDCGYVSDLYVSSQARLAGIGTALYVALRDWFHEREVTTIEVQIVRASTASQAFWRKMGFTDFLRTLRNDRIGP